MQLIHNNDSTQLVSYFAETLGERDFEARQDFINSLTFKPLYLKSKPIQQLNLNQINNSGLYFEMVKRGIGK